MNVVSQIKVEHERGPGIPSSEATDLGRLRALLLAADRAAIEANTQELLAEMQERVRRDELLDAISEILAAAFKDAEERDPKSMARALSPAVVKSIKREITNSRDEMVEALYPITGRLVRAAVRDAIGSLAADVNARLNAMTSPAIVSAHFKSLIYRKPASTFLLTQSQNAETFKNALLVDRSTGALIRRWEFGAPDETSTSSAQGLSSMLSAITAFAEQNHSEGSSELRTLDLNGSIVLVRQSPLHLVALEAIGDVSASLRLKADVIFDRILESLLNVEGLTAEALVGKASGNNTTNSKARGLVKPLVSILALAGAIATGWTIWERVSFNQKVEAVKEFLAQEAPNHQPLLLVDRGKQQLTVTGVVPPDFDISELAKEYARNGLTLVTNVQPVASSADIARLKSDLELSARMLTAQLRTMETNLIGLQQRQQELRQETMVEVEASKKGTKEELGLGLKKERENLVTLKQAFENSTKQFSERLAELSANLSETQADLSRSRSEIFEQARTLNETLQLLQSERQQRIKSDVESISIEFAKSETQTNSVLVTKKLEKVAAFIAGSNLTLQVAGHSDLTGDVTINEKISLERALWVKSELINLGANPDRISIKNFSTEPDREGRFVRQVQFSVLWDGT